MIKEGTPGLSFLLGEWKLVLEKGILSVQSFTNFHNETPT